MPPLRPKAEGEPSGRTATCRFPFRIGLNPEQAPDRKGYGVDKKGVTVIRTLIVVSFLLKLLVSVVLIVWGCDISVAKIFAAGTHSSETMEILLQNGLF